MRAGRRALAWALVAAATACSLQPVDVESRRELISQLPEDIPAAAPLPATLLVFLPTTNAAYDTTQIAYSEAPHELAYFARTEWAEKPAQMLHDLLVRTLERTRRFRAVVAPPYAGAVGYALNTQLLELRDDFTAEPAVVRLLVRVELRQGEDRAIATREFEVRQPMSAKSPYAGVAAANEAAVRVLRDIAAFVVANTR